MLERMDHYTDCRQYCINQFQITLEEAIPTLVRSENVVKTVLTDFKKNITKQCQR